MNTDVNDRNDRDDLDNTNPLKLKRNYGRMMLRSYLHKQAHDQWNAFVQAGDAWQAFLWNQTIEAVENAPTITDLMRLIQSVTADEQPEYVVLEALCSYREDIYKHVELVTPIVRRDCYE